MGTITACTLTPAEKPDPVARWRELFEHALNSRRVPGEAVITFDNADRVKSELDELIKLERICCAHGAWKLEETPDGGKWVDASATDGAAAERWVVDKSEAAE